MRAVLVVCVAMSVVLVLAGPVQPAPSGSQGLQSHALVSADLSASVADIVIEVCSEEAFDKALSVLGMWGAQAKFSSRGAGIISASVPEGSYGLVDALAHVPGVLSISPERTARVMFVPDDPGMTNQWALGKMDAYDAWDIEMGSHEVVVGVLDTGIDWNHPDLASNMWSNEQGYHGYNFIADNWFPMDDNVNGYDESGNWKPNTYTYHGTHVAGIVGAATDNGIGMAGLAQVRLMAVKVMNDSGEGTDSTVASGIRWATDNGAHVIVMSLGVDGVSEVLRNAVNYAFSRGRVLVAAAGNSGMSVLSYPAAFPNVIAVGASDPNDRKAEFSNYGTHLDLMGPGVNIYSTQGGGGYQYLSGTSAAAPQVAGVAALMFTVNPALSPVEVSHILNQTATDTSMAGYDTLTGWGVVNAFRAVEDVSDPTVTITSYPDYVRPNGTYSVTWLVSGGEPGVINETYVQWGFSPGGADGTSESFSGMTWAEFTVSGLPSLPMNGTIYLVAYAEVDEVMYESAVLELPVKDPPSDNMLLELFEQVQDFIMNDLGLFNFLVVMFVLIAIPIIVVAARSRGRARAAQAPPRPVQAPSSLGAYQAVPGAHPVPPPPPPPPRYEAYVDIVGQNVVPQVVKVVEGTKVVWVNRTWAPPPGTSIRSGTFGEGVEHHDGLFQSGLLIAPGDYWSCTFHKAGEYPYYITNLWRSGTVVVEPYKAPAAAPGPAT